MIGINRVTLKMQQQKEADEATRLKKYGDALYRAIPKQTNDFIEVVAFFRNIERLWDDFKVPVKLQGAIVKPFLTGHSKALVAKCDPSKSSYRDIKAALPWGRNSQMSSVSSDLKALYKCIIIIIYCLPPTTGEVNAIARNVVCLLARLLKNSCMDLDELLHVDRCRDMDELINF